MARKPINTSPSPEQLQFRARRRWQIALRRYVVEEGFSTEYAPYFGLDRANIRKWFELQFTDDLNWENCGAKWQFDHVIPLAYFNLEKEEDLKLCWNFTNLRVEAIQANKVRGVRVDVLAAKAYFSALYDKTNYKVCQQLIEKISGIESIELEHSSNQLEFMVQLKDYVQTIRDYSSYDFEMLNRGKDLGEVMKEIEMLKKIIN